MSNSPRPNGAVIFCALAALNDKFKMKEKHAKGNAVNVYWVLEAAEVPAGLKFIADKRGAQHYLLTVAEQLPMHVLVAKLTRMADRMAVIFDARKAL